MDPLYAYRDAGWDGVRDFIADHWIELHEYSEHTWLLFRELVDAAAQQVTP